MPKEPFLLVSLKEDKAKKLAQVVSNESCKRILEFLSEKDSTENEISKKLNIPISTVHYNMKLLVDTGLVECDEYHYSEKGKEVNHYRLANKYIIIAPKTTYGIREKLRKILPVAVLVGAGTALIQFFSRYIRNPLMQTFTSSKETLVRETVITQTDKIMPIAADTANEAIGGATTTASSAISTAAKSADAIYNTTTEVVNRTTEHLLEPNISTNVIHQQGSTLGNIALWFFIGAVFSLGLYLFIDYVRYKKK